MKEGVIRVVGARENNLRSVTCSVARGRLTVLTGPSGSGKSSLGLNTIHREAQHRFMSAAVMNARSKRPGRTGIAAGLVKPKVDAIEGLSFSLALGARPARQHAAAFAALCGAYDLLRLLFLHFSVPACSHCGAVFARKAGEKDGEHLFPAAAGSKIAILAPLGNWDLERLERERPSLLRDGASRIRVGGEYLRLESEYFDDDAARLFGEDDRKEAYVLIDSFKAKPAGYARFVQAVELGRFFSTAPLLIEIHAESGVRTERIGRGLLCSACGAEQAPLGPGDFSYYSPAGWCPGCRGRGEVAEADGRRKPCPDCQGARLKAEARGAVLAGRTFGSLFCSTVEEAAAWLEALKKERGKLAAAAAPGFGALLDRCIDGLGEVSANCLGLNLGYLQLCRSVTTLSGGEFQRGRIVREISSGLAGVTYVLDEPSAGLHPRDTEALVVRLRRLTQRSAAVLMIEHDLTLIAAADDMLELGPGGGENGGALVFQGTPLEAESAGTLTGISLRDRAKGRFPSAGRTSSGLLQASGFRKHNLKDVSFSVPLGLVTGVAGVSGSGKSSLVFDSLLPAVVRLLKEGVLTNQARDLLEVRDIQGWEELGNAVDARKFPGGRNPRSTVATASGIHNFLRDLFAQTAGARIDGLHRQSFSFNSPQGCCPVCKGIGEHQVPAAEFEEAVAVCDACGGTRYNGQVLRAMYHGMNIAEILALTANEAGVVLRHIPGAAARLDMMGTLGLGYLKLSQKTASLSQGELQRLAFVNRLSSGEGSGVLYAFDEPSSGLHAAETAFLSDLFHTLAGAGSTVVFIEHNAQMLSRADYIIELGPGGGERGGEIIACGTPAQLSASGASIIKSYMPQAKDDR